MKGRFEVHQLIFEDLPSFDFQNGFGTPKLRLLFRVNELVQQTDSRLVEMAGIEPASKKEMRSLLLS